MSYRHVCRHPSSLCHAPVGTLSSRRPKRVPACLRRRDGHAVADGDLEPMKYISDFVGICRDAIHRDGIQGADEAYISDCVGICRDAIQRDVM